MVSQLRSLASRIRKTLFGTRRSRAQELENVGPWRIFVHIPKNAGTSVAEALDMEKTWHYTALDYRRMLGYPAYAWRYSFAFVRNPWDRFLSLYRYARLDESRYHSAIDPESAPYGKHEDYDLLKNASVEECAHFLDEGRLEHDDFINHWRPQTDWLTDENGHTIVDFVGRVEAIDDDFQRVSDRLNLPVDTLPVANSSTKSSSSPNAVPEYRSVFTEEAYSLVAEYYREDIDRWGYKL